MHDEFVRAKLARYSSVEVALDDADIDDNAVVEMITELNDARGGVSFYDADGVAVDPVDAGADTITFQVQDPMLDDQWEDIEGGAVDLTTENRSVPIPGTFTKLRVLGLGAMDGVTDAVTAVIRVWKEDSLVRSGA